jgi:hypothetical protein
MWDDGKLLVAQHWYPLLHEYGAEIVLVALVVDQA